MQYLLVLICTIKIAERAKLKRENIAEIEGEEENINNKSFKEYFTNCQSPSDMYKKLQDRRWKK